MKNNAGNRDHFYTINVEEKDNAIKIYNYQDEGITGYIYETQQQSTTPLYRLYNAINKDHFYTINVEEKDNAIKIYNYQDEGITGYIHQTTPEDYNHIKYFGYYWDASEHPEMVGNYMSEFEDHCNVVFITGDEEKKLKEANARGMKAILAPYWHFSDGTGLRLNYLESWDKYVDIIKPLKDDILAFYPIDEPYWNGFNQIEIEKVTTAIKSEFPNTPIMVTFAYPKVNNDLIIPEGYDWISFDKYGTFDQIPEYYQIIKNKLKIGQKIILTADGFEPFPLSNNGEETRVIRAQQYYNLAKSDTNIIGIFPFLWPSFGEGKGVRDMPLVKEEFRKIGLEILSIEPTNVY